MQHVVKSRYGDERLFYYEDSKWFIDLKECHYVRFSANDKQEITAIDPDGGPYIAIVDNLCDLSSTLPDIRISQLEFLKAGVYQLT